MKKVLRLIAAGALLAAGIPLTASAQTITINATVNSQCNIGNATVNLGAITLANQTDNTGTSITLTCNKGATVSVALNDGINFTGAQKRMQRGATGDYAIFWSSASYHFSYLTCAEGEKVNSPESILICSRS